MATDEKTEKAAKAAPVAKAAPGGPPAQTARTHGGGWKAKFVADLIAAPNEWKVLEGVSPSIVPHLKKVEVKGGELEIVSRNSRFVPDRKTRVAEVYARFVPAGKVTKTA